MATEGIHPSIDTSAVTVVRHAAVAIAFNSIFAVGLAFFWFILRGPGPTVSLGLGDYAVWILASLAHLWYYSSESRTFKIVMTLASLAVNAVVLTNLERICAG